MSKEREPFPSGAWVQFFATLEYGRVWRYYPRTDVYDVFRADAETGRVRIVHPAFIRLVDQDKVPLLELAYPELAMREIRDWTSDCC